MELYVTLTQATHQWFSATCKNVCKQYRPLFFSSALGNEFCCNTFYKETLHLANDTDVAFVIQFFIQKKRDQSSTLTSKV